MPTDAHKSAAAAKPTRFIVSIGGAGSGGAFPNLAGALVQTCASVADAPTAFAYQTDALVGTVEYAKAGLGVFGTNPPRLSAEICVTYPITDLVVACYDLSAGGESAGYDHTADRELFVWSGDGSPKTCLHEALFHGTPTHPEAQADGSSLDVIFTANSPLLFEQTNGTLTGLLTGVFSPGSERNDVVADRMWQGHDSGEAGRVPLGAPLQCNARFGQLPARFLLQPEAPITDADSFSGVVATKAHVVLNEALVGQLLLGSINACGGNKGNLASAWTYPINQVVAVPTMQDAEVISLFPGRAAGDAALANHGYSQAGQFSDQPCKQTEGTLDRAIHCLVAALGMLSQEDTPTEWAMIQRSLGSAYFEREAGDRSCSIEQAIACFDAALTVFARQDDHQNWAATQGDLATAYRSRIAGDRTANLERALVCLEASSMAAPPADPAVKVFDKQAAWEAL